LEFLANYVEAFKSSRSANAESAPYVWCVDGDESAFLTTMGIFVFPNTDKQEYLFYRSYQRMALLSNLVSPLILVRRNIPLRN
jgi:hypothetical protein